MCVVDAAGVVTWQGRCASTPEAIATTLRNQAPGAERIGLETGPLSAWHWRALNAMGLPVVCIDARHAKAALAMQVNKTDANDALGLAQIVRTGWYREVRVKSEASYRTRSLLAARAKLVEMRREVSHQLRGLLQTFGHQVGVPGTGQGFEVRARELAEGDAALLAAVEALLGARTGADQHSRLDQVREAVVFREGGVDRREQVPRLIGLDLPSLGDPRLMRDLARVLV